VIVDTSALVAILAVEPDRDAYLEAINDADECSIAAPTLLETSIVLRRFGPQVSVGLDQFIREAGISVLPFESEQLVAARDADRQFGRATGHPAKLNFGDCFAYAAAIVTGRPLLFKGDDFRSTDVVPALP
jgi:ribonuclease VapC